MSGIIAPQKQLRVTNVIAHGPGIKLLNGLAEASTTGATTYAYHCRARLPTIVEANGTIQKFLTVFAPASRTVAVTPKTGGE